MTIKAGSIFPDIQVSTKDGEEVSLIPRATGNLPDKNETDWHLVVIYRGVHCPICAKYLSQIQSKLGKFKDLGVNVVAASLDSVEQLNTFLEEKVPDVTFPVYGNLKQDVAKNLGLLLSEPMSSAETDHVFAEPGIFVVNSERKVQLLEIANAPFVRPDLDILLGGLEYTRENDYPIRGTYE